MFALSMAPVAPRASLTAVSRNAADRLTAVNQELALMRQAVSDRGYTMDALAAAMEQGQSRQYVHAVLNGDKPMTLGFFVLLPEDVKARLIELQGPQYGLVVVRPVVGAEAIRQFVGGLIGLLTGKAA